MQPKRAYPARSLALYDEEKASPDFSRVSQRRIRYWFMKTILLCLGCLMELSYVVFATEAAPVKVQKVTFEQEGLLLQKYFVVSEFKVKNVFPHPIYLATQQNPEIRLYISSSVLHVDSSPMQCRDMSVEEPFWTLFERIIPGQIKYLKFRKRLDEKTVLPESVEYNLVYYDSGAISKAECINNEDKDRVLINCSCFDKMPKYNAFAGRSLIR